MKSLVLGLVLVAACGPSSENSGPGEDDPDAAPPLNDPDGDGYASPEDCLEGNPDVHPGGTEVCNGLDDDCSGRADEMWDLDSDGVASCNGDCNDSDPGVRPGFPEVCDGVDTDCNPLTDENLDADGDGYTLCTGDCNDDERLVNPGAVEVLTRLDGTPEGVDNDCDGMIDEMMTPCDSGVPPGDPFSFAKAMELCNWVSSATFSAGSSAQSRAVLADFGTYLPHYGAAFSVLASGIAADANDPGYVIPQPGTEFLNTAAHPDPQPDPGDGCGSADPATVNDHVELRLEIDVPSNAKSFSYDFNFMSSEYPEWVCSAYDDTFIAYLESSAFNGNISFDSAGRPVTINIAFFTVCDGGTGCTGSGPLAGTGYEAGVGGGTGWLTTTAPVVGGERITLRFIIFDEGDHILDSVVLLDNFRWEGEPVDAPVTVP